MVESSVSRAAAAIRDTFGLDVDSPVADVAELANVLVAARRRIGPDRRVLAERLGYKSVREMHEAAAAGVAARANPFGSSMSAARLRSRRLVAQDPALLVLGLYGLKPVQEIKSAIDAASAVSAA